MRFTPDSVIDGGDFDRADLVFVVSNGWLDRRIGESRAGEDQGFAQP